MPFDPWGPISSLLFDLESDSVQRIIERAGLALDWSLTEREEFSHKTRNRAYRGKVSRALTELSPEDQRVFILNVAIELPSLNALLREQLRVILQRIGWDFIEDRLIQIDILSSFDISNLPGAAVEDLSRAAERLTHDLSGAISAACGAVESICATIYTEHSLGDISEASFQEKVNKSLLATGTLERLKENLLQIGWEASDADRFQQNLKGAINHAAYVMQSLRSRMGDVHGSQPALATIAFDSIKWAMIISSLLKNDHV